MLNTLIENKNKKYYDLGPRFKRKDGNIIETFAFVFHHCLERDEASG